MVLTQRAVDDSDIVGMGIVTLRGYASEVDPATEFEAHVQRTLRDLGVSVEVAQRLISNFDRLNKRSRLFRAGPLGLEDATLDKEVAKGSFEPLPPGTAQVTFPIARPPVTLGEDAGVKVDIDSGIPAVERYGVVYKGLYCVDETGIDSSGSDEIYVITSAHHYTSEGLNIVTTVGHPQGDDGISPYGDVDSHNSRVGPEASCWNFGIEEFYGGMSLRTVVMEHDKGDPNYYKEEVDAAVKLGLGIGGWLYPPAAPVLALIGASELATKFINSLLGTGDDKVGENVIVIETAELESFSRTRLKKFFAKRIVWDGGPTLVNVKTELDYHFLAPVNDNDYYVAYQVVRIPEAPLYKDVVE